MNTAYIHTLYAYDRWANARVLEAAAKLAPGEFTKNLGSSFASVRDTLVHILSGERVWLARWKGAAPAGMLEAERFPSVDMLRVAWAELEAELAVFLAALDDQRLQAVVPYRTLAGAPQAQPLWQQMAHLANHSTYHRGQVATLLRQLGAQPIGTDLIAFFREQAGSDAAARS
ncbi:MAG TPA: DinB family protein [Terriglobia bacterium]|nr:DinB family protein [Terriglobia bacterium]